ncbi:aminoacyl-tRNA hydrolase [Oceanihabitans sediminis]|uniref:Peptidyl-tRNA hydrolase n=1 Tax=Oceanihabitans sediminis TaxID=1812012 RepID=A0A368P6J3_9FLAO|nr:aminoacyl-tRNA hydrolase [Oceanihabitans sediminis]MDX1277459.1 aminoacyl-tRNA hydrolase [Oceanihabitans sediminis]MDX1772800.1 aminoacyl-tRNA hydrolase [Oceanihabitans sediminis]RBP34478.1 peptidyl-tRNA hydrolase [Oceanihabitans sediminis]RCU58148.1 aminoacyl-tRNA hydrolase [Oceanihabitans sediminis]
MCTFLKHFFKQKETLHKIEEIDTMKKYLIVGLGNIGDKYTNTRHNIGFKILDHFAKKEDLTFETQKLGEITSYRFKGRTFIFLKPSTYMNLSGKAILYWLTKEKIPLENLLVITDDLNLPFGSIRLKTKGSDGGHNGLKDTQEKLNTTKYNRFRFGISDAFSKGSQVDYVLGEWTEEENAKLPERLDKATELIKSFGTAGVNNTMNTFNGK